MIFYEEMDGFPKGILDLAPSEIYNYLSRPTIIHIPGRSGRPLLISVMLHGNEHTGWLAIQNLLLKQSKKGVPLSRPITVLIGNPRAAHQNRRMLPGEEDHNRIWTESNSKVQGHLVQRIVEMLKEREYFLCLDVHNNTGKNPLYCCTPSLDHQHLSYCGLFGPTSIFFRQPESTQTIFLSQFCPSLTIECGRSGEEPGLSRATEFIDSLIHMQELPKKLTRNLSVFETIVRLRLRENISIKFTTETSTSNSVLNLRPDLDDLNFLECDTPVSLGTFGGSADELFLIDGLGDHNPETQPLTIAAGKILLSPHFIPSMFTLDERVIRQDCLGYLMRRISIQTF